MAAVGSLANGLPVMFRLIVFIAVLVSCYVTLRHYLISVSKDLLVIAHNESEGWSLQSGSQAIEFVDVMSNSVSTRIVIILNFVIHNKQRRSVVIFKDSLDEESYRQLRVLMRIRCDIE